MGTQRKPSDKYKDVARNTLASVSGYWKNKDFTTAEGYASVKVIDSIDGKAEIDDFMNYLCEKGDAIRDVETMGKWNVIPQTIDEIMGEGFESSITKEIESPRPQPLSNPVPPPKFPASSVIEESKSVPIRESLIPPSIARPKTPKTKEVVSYSISPPIASTPVAIQTPSGGGSGPSRIIYTTSTNVNGFEEVREQVMNRFL